MIRFLYSFMVTGNLNPVAVFGQAKEAYEITVLAAPAEGGTVGGGGTHAHDRQVTVQALALEGYVFTRWTEAGVPVSTDARYTFTARRDRTLTAHFSKKASLPGVLMLLLGDE